MDILIDLYISCFPIKLENIFYETYFKLNKTIIYFYFYFILFVSE